jgi:hypothetical protein
VAVATAPFGASGLFSDGGIRPNDATSAPTEFSASLRRGGGWFAKQVGGADVTFTMPLMRATCLVPRGLD